MKVSVKSGHSLICAPKYFQMMRQMRMARRISVRVDMIGFGYAVTLHQKMVTCPGPPYPAGVLGSGLGAYASTTSFTDLVRPKL